MKKFNYSLFAIAILTVIGISCKPDDSLDPLQFKNMKKGTVLALRGTQLNNIYNLGLPGAEFYPRDLTGTEKFTFDAEFLSADPSTLESAEVFVINDITHTRVSVKVVSASEFKTTDDYTGPWATISINFSDVLPKIGITTPIPSPETTAALFDLYPNGIQIRVDLTLTDGSKVLADDIVAAGLFQSNQFYPAMQLTWTLTDYCREDLHGDYDYLTVVTAFGDGGKIAQCDPAGLTGTGTLKSIALGKYSIPDASFGSYDCLYDDNPATGVTLQNTCDKLKFGGADQYALAYRITNVQVNGDGSELSFTWDNDYGDKANTTLTRAAGGWPTTLFSN